MVAVKVMFCPADAGFKLDASVVVVGIWFIVSVTAAEGLPLKFAVLPYTAVRLCAPGASVGVVSCAELLASVPVPKLAEPSRKVTVPVTEIPEPACRTAVSVTACPNVAGFKLDVSVVVVASGFTVSVSTADVLPKKVPSPEDSAVIEWG